MAGGEAGVQRAGDLLAAGITRTMALMGATTVADLTPERVRIRPLERAQVRAPAADHRGVILLALTIWTAASTGVVACCVAARRGDRAL